MKFLVDVNIGMTVVNDLIAAGHDAIYIAIRRKTWGVFSPF